MDEGSDHAGAYAVALRDWLGCAHAARDEPAARAARALGGALDERVLAAGTAGHVLDFDDTYLPGLAHLSAPVAPAALVLGAELDATAGDALAAYAAGFEAMGAVAAASHPGLYRRGFHPTALCGAVGAATAAARLLGLDPDGERTALATALIGAAGLRAGFGSDAKSLQVGAAAAAGVRAARLAAAGASVPLERVARGDAGFEAVLGGRLEPPRGRAAVSENWIKAYPCCLQTHAPVEAADRARRDGVRPGDAVAVAVHPVSLDAAPFGAPLDGLQAKFSIGYLAAFALLHGPPREPASFATVDDAARELGGRIEVRADPGLLESEAVLLVGGEEVARVEAALGSPARPMSGAQLAAKLRLLAGDRLDGVLDDPARPAAELLAAAGLD